MSFVVMEVHLIFGVSAAQERQVPEAAELRQPAFYIILEVERAQRSHINM